MKNATTRRLRGFRIQVYHKGKPSIITPTIWAEQPPVEQWERVTQDPETIQADLFRSGRKMKGYHYKRTG